MTFWGKSLKSAMLDCGQRIGTNAIAVLAALEVHANRERVAWPSVETLARCTGLSRASVFRALSALVTAKLVRVEQRFRTTSRYHLADASTIPEGSQCETVEGSHRETQGSHRETQGSHRETQGSHRETQGSQCETQNYTTEHNQRSNQRRRAPLSPFVAQIQQHAPNAPDWYPAWCSRHAKRFSWNRADDPELLASWWADHFAELPELTQDELDKASSMVSKDNGGLFRLKGRPDHPPRLLELVRKARADSRPDSQPPPPQESSNGENPQPRPRQKPPPATPEQWNTFQELRKRLGGR